MEWDLGLQGIAVLALCSLAFGVFAYLVTRRYVTRWVGLFAAAGYFVCGLLISEVWFGWATEEELQPNIDGLSFDETLLAWIPGVIAVLLVRHAARKRHSPNETGHATAAHA